MIVRFSDSNEFLEELEREPNAIARKLVRLTKLARAAGAGVITVVSVIATAKVVSGSDYDLLRLEILAGELWGIDRTDTATQKRASDLIALLESSLQAAGFTVAAGVYELEPVA